MTTALARLARRAGTAARDRDPTGQDRETSPETERALLAAMGLPAATEAEAAEAAAALAADAAARTLPLWVVVTADQPAAVSVAGDPAWTLALEDGTVRHGKAADGRLDLPALPMGYHTLTAGGAEATVLAAPAALPLPAPDWGVTLPLYGLRPADRGGFGDYVDLEVAVRELGRAGAGFVGINPIHAGFPTDTGAHSPYSPSSRRRLSTAHIAVPGAAGATGELVDYAHDLPAKRAALEAAFAALPAADRETFAAWRAGEGAALERFATHQALSDLHGPYWPDWPAAYRDPDSDAVAAFARDNPDRLTFHAWAQWMATRQLEQVRTAAADMRHGLYLDLAVGAHPGGAETWEERESFAHGVSLGAPPDAFSPAGQAWNLAPLEPRALVAQGFRPLAETLRAQFRFARLLRIDHILGFDRGFWVPTGGELPGAYVAMPRAAMLAVTRIEAARAGATVIGEDLGNVPEGLREDLDASGLLGCRVAMFERESDDPPRFRAAPDYDAGALAAFGSHDLPTWAGWRAGRDIDWWQVIGHLPEAQAGAARARRATEVAAFDTALGTTDGSAGAMHAFLARTPSRLVAVQAEDIFGLSEQANLPGTVFAHPNWRRRLPVPPESFGADPRVARTARTMGDNRPPDGRQT